MRSEHDAGSSPTSKFQLSVSPRGYRFGHRKSPWLEPLQQILKAQESTEPVPIESLQQVLIGERGLVQSNLRYTTSALGQLCSLLCPGLALFISNISSSRPAGLLAKDTAYSPQLAARTINAAIRLRYDSLLQGCYLIVDSQHRRIEGVVGPRYRFISNLEIMDRVLHFSRTGPCRLRFYEAALVGRRLMIRLRERKPLFVLAAPDGSRDAYYAGYQFVNSEIGKASVKVAFVLYRASSRTSAVYETGRLVHVKGGSFDNKFQRAIASLRQHAEVERARLETSVIHARDVLLGLGSDPESHARRVRVLLVSLIRGRLFKRTAQQVVERALVAGSYEGELRSSLKHVSDLSPDLKLAFQSRTLFDLINALMFMAGSYSPEQQETAEKLAYRLLTDRFKIL